MRIGVLEFCGVKPVKSSDEVKRKKWLAEVEKLGKVQK